MRTCVYRASNPTEYHDCQPNKLFKSQISQRASLVKLHLTGREQFLVITVLLQHLGQLDVQKKDEYILYKDVMVSRRP